MADEGQERFDSVVRDYIDFVNEQVGAYMDALAGFSGHHSKVERQVHRVQRKISQRNENGETVWSGPATRTRQSQTSFITA